MKKLLNIAIAATAAAFIASPVLAEWEPSGPITLRVAFGAGGSTDALARSMAKAVEDDTGWTIVVENAPGGGGVAMLTRLRSAKPDGRSLGIGVNTPIWFQLTQRPDQLPFTLDSFEWLATIGRAALVLAVTSDSPMQSYEALIDQAKSDVVTVATNGPAQEMIVRALGAETGANLVPVPTKSESEMIKNLLGGHVVAATLGGTQEEFVASGDIAVVAGLTPRRDSAAPDAPTILEQGIPFALDPAYYIAAPKGLDQDAKAALVTAFQAAMAKPEMRQALANMAVEPVELGPEETAALMNDGFTAITTIVEAATK